MSGQAAARLLQWWARQPCLPPGYKITARRVLALVDACRDARRHAVRGSLLGAFFADCSVFAGATLARMSNDSPTYPPVHALSSACIAVGLAARRAGFAEVLAKMSQRSVP